MPSIDIHRFGPITQGQIDLAPLTVLIGPNGSGKSYAAMILHSLNREGNFSRRLSFGLTNNILDVLSEEQQDELQLASEELQSQGRTKLPHSIFNTFVRIYYQIFFENKLNDNLESVFATDITDLIKEGHTGIRFDINSEIGEARLKCYSSYDGLELEY